MKLAWLTDLHLNFLKPKDREEFISRVNDMHPDAVLLGGDIDEADTVAATLETLAGLGVCPCTSCWATTTSTTVPSRPCVLR